MEQNQQSISPEELFKQMQNLDACEQQVFSLNAVNLLILFHEYVIEDLDYNDESFPFWISDLEKLKLCSHLLDSLSS